MLQKRTQFTGLLLLLGSFSCAQGEDGAQGGYYPPQIKAPAPPSKYSRVTLSPECSSGCGSHQFCVAYAGKAVCASACSEAELVSSKEADCASSGGCCTQTTQVSGAFAGLSRKAKVRSLECALLSPADCETRKDAAGNSLCKAYAASSGGCHSFYYGGASGGGTSGECERLTSQESCQSQASCGWIDGSSCTGAGDPLCGIRVQGDCDGDCVWSADGCQDR